jgi:hypothetical protein
MPLDELGALIENKEKVFPTMLLQIGLPNTPTPPPVRFHTASSSTSQLPQLAHAIDPYFASFSLTQLEPSVLTKTQSTSSPLPK